MASEETGVLTALVVPVPVADWLIESRGSSPARVTLIAHFLPRSQMTDGLLAELRTLFGDVVPFTFDVDAVCAFPSGEVYLAPEPPTPFRQLTARLTRRFPEHPAQGDPFPDLVPHVTVPLLDGESQADVEGLVRARGPLQALATEVQLVGEDGPEVLAVFPFGTAAA